MKKDWKVIAGIILGLSIAGSMLFANQLGLDNNAAWGLKRIAFFFLGIFILITSLLYKEDNFIDRLFNTKTGSYILPSDFLAYLSCLHTSGGSASACGQHGPPPQIITTCLRLHLVMVNLHWKQNPILPCPFWQ